MLLMMMCLLLLLCVGRERRGERGEGRCAAGDPLLCMVSARSRYEGVFFFFFFFLHLVHVHVRVRIFHVFVGGAAVAAA